MTDFNTIRRPATTAQRAAVYDEGLRAYMNKVYGLMTAGMLVTAVVAWSFAQMAGGPGAWMGMLRSVGGIENDFVTEPIEFPKNWDSLVRKYRNVRPTYEDY